MYTQNSLNELKLVKSYVLEIIGNLINNTKHATFQYLPFLKDALYIFTFSKLIFGFLKQDESLIILAKQIEIYYLCKNTTLNHDTDKRDYPV